MGVGFAVAARSWWVGIVLVVMFLAIYMPVIRDEEEFLQRTFPEFDEYAQRVPRMVPRLTAYADDNNKGQSGFSLGLYLKHREYNALLGAAAMTASATFQAGPSQATENVGRREIDVYFCATNFLASPNSGLVEFDPPQTFSSSA